jgi:hypothetical protein
MKVKVEGVAASKQVRPARSSLCAKIHNHNQKNKTSLNTHTTCLKSSNPKSNTSKKSNKNRIKTYRTKGGSMPSTKYQATNTTPSAIKSSVAQLCHLGYTGSANATFFETRLLILSIRLWLVGLGWHVLWALFKLENGKERSNETRSLELQQPAGL